MPWRIKLSSKHLFCLIEVKSKRVKIGNRVKKGKRVKKSNRVKIAF